MKLITIIPIELWAIAILLALVFYVYGLPGFVVGVLLLLIGFVA